MEVDYNKYFTVWRYRNFYRRHEKRFQVLKNSWSPCSRLYGRPLRVERGVSFTCCEASKNHTASIFRVTKFHLWVVLWVVENLSAVWESDQLQQGYMEEMSGLLQWPWEFRSPKGPRQVRGENSVTWNVHSGERCRWFMLASVLKQCIGGSWRKRLLRVWIPANHRLRNNSILSPTLFNIFIRCYVMQQWHKYKISVWGMIKRKYTYN